MTVKLPNAFNLASVLERKVHHEESHLYDIILSKFAQEVPYTLKKSNCVSITVKDPESITFSSEFQDLLKNHITDAGYVDVSIRTNYSGKPSPPSEPDKNLYQCLINKKPMMTKIVRSVLYGASILPPMIDMLFAPYDIAQWNRYSQKKKQYEKDLKHYENNNVVVHIQYSLPISKHKRTPLP